jgi:hypothetical protein
MKSEAAHAKTFRLSKKLKVAMTAGAGGYFVCEWIPCTPNRMTRKELRAYRAARDEMVRCLGASALVIEASGGK